MHVVVDAKNMWSCLRSGVFCEVDFDINIWGLEKLFDFWSSILLLCYKL
jgi:hypothetical protein